MRIMKRLRDLDERAGAVPARNAAERAAHFQRLARRPLVLVGPPLAALAQEALENRQAVADLVARVEALERKLERS